MLDVRNHVSRIVSSANQLSVPMPEGRPMRVGDTMVASWRRCMDSYRFDPAAKFHIEAVSDAELKVQREAGDELMRIAKPEIDAMFGAVSLSGFSISLANAAGYVLSERSNYHSDFYSEVERPGTAWAEQAAGTNGIGTCLVEKRPVAVLTNDHFFYEFSSLSCAVAPLYGPDAEMIGAINLSIRNPALQQDTLGMVLGLTTGVADRIGELMFRHAFRRNYILKFATSPVDHGLIAIDSDFHLVGLNHAARETLQDRVQLARVRSLWAVFERDHRLFDLARLGGSEMTLHLSKGGDAISVSLSAPSELPVSRPAAARAQSPAPAAPVREPAPAIAKPAENRLTLDDCAGRDPQMAANTRFVRRVLGGSLPILLLGETGVGKDAFAQAIHYESPRREGPFVAFNCAAVPDTLIDSEMFGYGGGAFTGARREGSNGRLADADGGTLFLDEIGDMPIGQQTRLLQVLESGEVTPLGTGKPRRIDIQVIAATNQDLDARIRAGTFRQDLYYRLAGAVVDIPALRARADLGHVIRALFARLSGPRELSLSPEAMDHLDWPGNIRELRHVLNRAVHMCEGNIVTAADLMLRGAAFETPRAAMPAAPFPALLQQTTEMTDASAVAEAGTARHAIASAEREAIVAMLARSGGNVKAAAAALKLSRATLYRKLQRYQIAH